MEGLKRLNKPNFMRELGRVLGNDVLMYVPVGFSHNFAFHSLSFNLSSLFYNESDISTAVLYLRL
jgi:hypothetical protein